MKAVKQPKWDKQEGPPIVLANPNGPNKNPSFTEPLSVGQEAIGAVGGIEIVLLLTDIVTATQAKGEIKRILDGLVDLDAVGDLSLGDIVLIDRKDMYSLNIDTELS